MNETLNLIKIKNNQSQVKRKISSNQKMIYLPRVKKIFTFGEKLMIFGMVSTELTDLCDTQSVLGCFYKPSKFSFYTICLKKIKVWNVFNGKLKYVFDDFLPNQNSEITAFFTDKSMKKIYIGDCFGNIVCLNLNSCKVLKTYESSKSEIVSICHSQKLNLVISLDINSIIRIYKDKDFIEHNLLKEISLEKTFMKCLKINEEYSRIIIGTQKGELKYLDIEHLKFDISINENKEEKIKLSEEDPINEIYTFDDYPLCIAFHESALNIFEIIPPNYYKFRTFGKFKNVINKYGSEKKVKITACEFDKKNEILMTGDYFGFVHCYSLKKLLGYIQNLNLNENSKENIKYLEELENYKLEKLFSFEACKEKIKNINFPLVKPNIIVITGNDRRVKLFSSNDGSYIDEFKQSTENLKEFPVGLKYYFSDPFVSKINSDKELKYDFVYKKDIINYKPYKAKEEINSMKANHKPIFEYIDNIIKLNAKERLYLITKNSNLPIDKSSAWKYEPNLDLIQNNERKLSIVETKDKSFYEYNPIESKKYYPKFINYMEPEKLRIFSDSVNTKIRKVQLNLAKIDLNNDKFKNYEKIDPKRTNNTNYKGFKIILDKKYINKNSNYTKISQKKNKIREKFNDFKIDFDTRINDLANMFESKLLYKENKKTERKYLLTSHKIFERPKKINIHLLPNINNINKERDEKNNFKLKIETSDK